MVQLKITAAFVLQKDSGRCWNNKPCWTPSRQHKTNHTRNPPKRFESRILQTCELKVTLPQRHRRPCDTTWTNDILHPPEFTAVNIKFCFHCGATYSPSHKKALMSRPREHFTTRVPRKSRKKKRRDYYWNEIIGGICSRHQEVRTESTNGRGTQSVCPRADAGARQSADHSWATNKKQDRPHSSTETLTTSETTGITEGWSPNEWEVNFGTLKM